MGERRLNAIGSVVAHGERDSACGGNRTMVSKASTVLGELRYQLRLKLGHFGHVLAIAGVQNPPRHLVTYLVAVAGELRALAHHLGRNGVLLFKHWRHALLFRKLQRLLPPFQRQMTTDLFSERQRRLRAVGNFQHGQGRTKT